jgi:hypothetical protein
MSGCLLIFAETNSNTTQKLSGPAMYLLSRFHLVLLNLPTSSSRDRARHCESSLSRLINPHIRNHFVRALSHSFYAWLHYNQQLKNYR